MCGCITDYGGFFLCLDSAGWGGVGLDGMGQRGRGGTMILKMLLAMKIHIILQI